MHAGMAVNIISGICGGVTVAILIVISILCYVCIKPRWTTATEHSKNGISVIPEHSKNGISVIPQHSKNGTGVTTEHSKIKNGICVTTEHSKNGITVSEMNQR